MERIATGRAQQENYEGKNEIEGVEQAFVLVAVVLAAVAAAAAVVVVAVAAAVGATKKWRRTGEIEDDRNSDSSRLEIRVGTTLEESESFVVGHGVLGAETVSDDAR